MVSIPNTSPERAVEITISGERIRIFQPFRGSAEPMKMAIEPGAVAKALGFLPGLIQTLRPEFNLGNRKLSIPVVEGK